MPTATLDSDFELFWQRFPRKVGKLAARKEYDKVRRGGIGQDELLDGIAQYVRTKPSYADWCHPRTWLSQGRWMDETPKATARADCRHDPRCPDQNSHWQLEEAEASGDRELVAGIRRVIARRVSLR
jgi:hypothetical protein